MKGLRTRLSALLGAGLLSACTLITPPPPPADLAALRQQHQYVAALAHLQPADPTYLQQRQAILEEATRYQSQLLQSLRLAMDKQDYVSAQNALATALPQLPPNAELTAFQAEFERARGRYVQDKLDDLYQLRGEHLLKEQSLYQSLQGLAGDDDLQVAVARFQADADYFAKLLAAAGNEAMARQDYAAARKYLTTANQLRPSPELGSTIATAVQALETQREKTKQTRLSEREQRYRRIETQLQQALDKSDFAQARTQLAALREVGLHLPEVEDYRLQLNDAIAATVRAETDAGNRSYADGRIEEALVHWRAAADLQPGAELQERIEKAEKFIQRYRDLQQEKQTQPR